MTVFAAEINGAIVSSYLTDHDMPWLDNSTLNARWYCELWDRGDDCGGSAGVPYNLGSLVFKAAIGGAWIRNPVHANVCDYVNPSAYTHCLTTSNSTMKFWSTH